MRELHKPARKNFKRRRTIIRSLLDGFQIDLAEMRPYARENKGYNYILVVINCFSKFLWTRALKTKQGKEVTAAMESIILEDPSKCPKNIQSDLGKEFWNSDFQSLMKKYKINHYHTYSVIKAAMAERVIRTLKLKLYKLFSLQGTYRWIDILEEVTRDYNNTRHRTTGMKPIKITKQHEQQLLKTVYNFPKIVAKNIFQKGDVVRISKHKMLFEKGFTPTFTPELFKVVKVNVTNPTTYLLEDMQGQPIKGCFYEDELQKTKQPDIYLVEKVLKRKDNKLYVKWLGFPSSHNSWISAKDVA